MPSLITKLIAGEVEMPQYELGVLIAGSNDPSDTVHLNEIATNVESLEF